MDASNKHLSGGRTGRLTREERREQLLDVTRAIVGADGFHAVSIDRVAREAGISRPIVYEHFEDLAGLLQALLLREGLRARAQIDALIPARAPNLPVDEVLLETLGAYLEAVASDPITWRLMLMPPEGAPAFVRTQVEDARATVVARLTELLEPGGTFLVRDPELFADAVLALAVHWSRLMLLHPERFDRGRILASASWTIGRLTGIDGRPR